MARLIVRFPDLIDVEIDGAVRGQTNRLIHLDPGEHVVRLKAEATDPEHHVVTVGPSALPDEIVRLAFQPAAKPIARFSPLYCRYNGFLLGQFLTLSFASYGRQAYPVRRARMHEFLNEIGVDLPLPDEAPELGSETHSALLTGVAAQLADRSRDLTDFMLLGSLLTHHGILAATDEATAKDSLEQIEWIRQKHTLPPIDPTRFILSDASGRVDDVLSPSLAYLADSIAQLDVEADTAFVIMPFKQPYASYFATLYRPSLEAAGYRAFRAWGGLSNEDYADLLLKLIAKSGMVWADVSELNNNVLYEIGAAHALGKLSVLVVREDEAATVPANIGHDAVIQYPAPEKKPEEVVAFMAALISTIEAAAARGRRLRIGPEGVQAALEELRQVFPAILVPPEAREAAKRGAEQFANEDYGAAELAFDEAIQLGLDDGLTRAMRGTTRVLVGKYGEAEADLTSALDAEEDTTQAREQRMTAFFFRGVAREQQDNFTGAREDYGAAIALGYPDVAVYQRRALVSIACGDLATARADAEQARAMAPDDPETRSLWRELTEAESRQKDAPSPAGAGTVSTKGESREAGPPP